MAEFEVEGNAYSCGRIPARTQHHLVRRLAPFATALMALKNASNVAEDPSIFIRPMADALSKMSDEDSDFIFDTCLGVVKRKQGDAGWRPIIATGTASQLMFQDIDLMTQYLLIGHVLQDSLGPFIDGVRRAFVKALATKTTTSE